MFVALLVGCLQVMASDIPADAHQQLSAYLVQSREGVVMRSVEMRSVVTHASTSKAGMLLAAKGFADHRTIPKEDRATLGGNLYCPSGAFLENRCDFRGRAMGMRHVSDLPYLLRAEMPFMWLDEQQSEQSVHWYVLFEDTSEHTVYMGAFHVRLPGEMSDDEVLVYLKSDAIDLDRTHMFYQVTMAAKTQEEARATSAVLQEFPFGGYLNRHDVPQAITVSQELSDILTSKSGARRVTSQGATADVYAPANLVPTQMEANFAQSLLYNGGMVSDGEQPSSITVRNFSTPKDTLRFVSHFAETAFSPTVDRLLVIHFNLQQSVAMVAAYRTDITQVHRRETFPLLALIKIPVGTPEDQRIAVQTLEVMLSGIPNLEPGIFGTTPTSLYSTVLATREHIGPKTLKTDAAQTGTGRILIITLGYGLLMIGILLALRIRRKRLDEKRMQAEVPRVQGVTRVVIVEQSDEDRRRMDLEAEEARQRTLAERRKREEAEREALRAKNTPARPEPTPQELQARKEELLKLLTEMLNNPDIPSEQVELINQQMNKAKAETKLSRQIKFLEYPLTKQ